MNADKPVLFTGIKPTGEIHIGNYFGAIRQMVDLAGSGEYTTYMMVADYHALNSVQDAKHMRALTHDLVLTYLACGLDPNKVVLFKQSAVPAHTELAWIFDTITTMPYLMRAHAYKDAEAKGKELSVGTFNYPMLMAADILLYDAAKVPVGADQKQHIEYTRDTAEKFNRMYGATFTLPAEFIMPDVAVVPGIDGQKMSKSYGNTIPLFASREELQKLAMSIVTDSTGARPENVYAMHKLVRSEDELAFIYESNQGNYKALKESLANDLDALIAPMRAKYEELKRTPEIVAAVLEQGNAIARDITEAKMQQVRRAVGVQ